MTPLKSHRLTALLLWLGAVATASAQTPLTAPPKEEQAKVVAIEKLLEEIRIETKPFQNEVPLADFLRALEKQFPKDKRLSLRLDAEAFGKDFAAVAATPVKLPPIPKRMTLGTVLEIALSKISTTPVDYCLGPTHFAITSPRKALYTHTYDIRAHIERSVLLDTLESGPGSLGVGLDLRDLQDTDGAALLVRLILCTIDPDSWSPTAAAPGTIRVLNGTHLVVRTNATRHAAVENLLALVPRLRDLAVVMNARLLEVERAFYVRHIAPLLTTGGRQGTVRLAAPIHDEALLKKLRQQKEVVKGSALKIRPGQPTTFLALQEPYRYIAHPGNAEVEPLKVYRTGLAGVSFRARAAVSPDRRSLRLKITQEVAELLEIKKSTVLDPATGKDCPVESPNVRQNALTATVPLDDGQPFLMPVDYRPSAGAKDRLWILLAEPIIWIAEEQEQIRRGNIAPIPRPVAKDDKP